MTNPGNSGWVLKCFFGNPAGIFLCVFIIALLLQPIGINAQEETKNKEISKKVSRAKGNITRYEKKINNLKEYELLI